jgi:hypothetical protein
VHQFVPGARGLFKSNIELVLIFVAGERIGTQKWPENQDSEMAREKCCHWARLAWLLRHLSPRGSPGCEAVTVTVTADDSVTSRVGIVQLVPSL